VDQNALTPEVEELLKDVIDLLIAAKEQPNGSAGKTYRRNASEKLDELVKLDPRNKSTYKDVKDKLGNQIATSVNQSAGHYEILIKRIRAILK